MNEESANDGKINVKVASPTALVIGKLIVFQVAPDSTVLDLKQAILDKFPVGHSEAPSTERQRLIFRGQFLEDAKTIATVLKENGSEGAKSVHFHLVVRPLEAPAPKGKGSGMGGLLKPFFGSSDASSSSNATAPVAPPQQAPTVEPAQPESNTASQIEEQTTPIVATNAGPSSRIWDPVPAFAPPPASPELPRQDTATSNDHFEIEFSRSGNAGILNIDRFTSNASYLSEPSIYITLPSGVKVPVPANQVSFVRNYQGELLCCLSPDSIKRLSLMANKEIRTEGLHSRACIHNFLLERPIYNPDLEATGRNLYISLPQKYTPQGAVPQPTHTQPLPQAVAAVNAQQQPLQPQPQAGNGGGAHIQIGNRRLDINVNFFRNNFNLLVVLFRVYVFEEIFAHAIVNPFHFWAVMIVATLVSLWHADMLPDHIVNLAEVRQRLGRLVEFLPHRHPQVPQAAPPPPAAAAAQQPAADQRREPNENENATENDNLLAEAGGQGREESRWGELLWQVQGILFMFVGSLFPFVYENWVREDRRRHEHVERRERERRRALEAEQQQQEERQQEPQQEPLAEQVVEELPTEELAWTEDTSSEESNNSFSNAEAGPSDAPQLGQSEIEPVEGTSSSSQYHSPDKSVNRRL